MSLSLGLDIGVQGRPPIICSDTVISSPLVPQHHITLHHITSFGRISSGVRSGRYAYPVGFLFDVAFLLNRLPEGHGPAAHARAAVLVVSASAVMASMPVPEKLLATKKDKAC